MARRETERLSARTVATITKPGRHADGGNLFLSINGNGGRRWTFLYRDRSTHRLREMGLGPAPGPRKSAGLSLQDARRKAAEARRLLYHGVDPLAEKRAKRAAASATTFGAFADDLLKTIAPGFRNEKHVEQWAATLRNECAPLRPLALDAINTEAVLRVLQPIWESKHETATRVRGRIERVLDAARAKGLRRGENPARWKGHLKELLAKRRTLTRGHHKALPYAEAAGFMRELRARNSVSALALEFAILTAARTGEVIGADWSEIDLSGSVWTIPGRRMKAAKEHRVPLSDRALAILRSLILEGVEPRGFIFPGARRGAALSNMALLECVKDLRPGVTVHGFRSTFRDWAAETTAHENFVVESALAHTISNKAERAYRRGDLFDKRRALMADWAKYLKGESAS